MSDSRAALLAAAAEEFARDGPKGARIQAIVARAGVNERMIYHHFGSKDDLYAAVLEDQSHGLVQAWRQLIDRAAQLPPYEGMRMALAGFADQFAKRPLLTAASASRGGAAVPEAAGAVGAWPARGSLPRRRPVRGRLRRGDERPGRQRRPGATRRGLPQERRVRRRPGQARGPGRRPAGGGEDRTTRAEG